MIAHILQVCLINMFFITQNVETGCQEFKPGINVFGPSCGFMCHCVDGDKCHDVTGECTSGCVDEWAGPGCQYRDVAKGNYAEISENLPDSIRADYANDGNVSTCTRLVNSLNETDENPWWRVWLPYNETIQGLSIITTTDNESLPNVDFNVYVEKVPEYNQSTDFISTSVELCYKQEQAYSSTVPKNILCSFPIHGNLLRIELQSRNSVLNICDLRVFGGRNMAFKKDVTLSSTLRDSQLVVDGVKTTDWKKCSATNGAEKNWMMIDLQTRVKIQAFHLNYSNAAQLLNYTLDVSDDSINWHSVYNDQNKSPPTTLIHLNVDARFVRVYTRTYRRNYDKNERMVACEIEVFGDCLVNTCGWDCSKICHCDKLTESDISYGNCSNGCKGRWTGYDGRCDTECGNGSYGLDCNSSCSGNCLNNAPCNLKSGHCDEGCASGWIGEKCDNECPDGKYWYNCTEDCSGLCRNSSACRKTDGHCVNGCVDGFRGEKCDLSCDSGKYGLNCSFNCSGRCFNNSACSKTNGNCTSGCEQGWTGFTCNEKCQSQTYGLNCAFNCSGHCLNGTTCLHTNGTCMKGCETGWTGHNCRDECPDYTYGLQCKYNCSDYCKNNTTCNKRNGYCTEGCEAGWGGNNCKEECQTGSYGSDCHMNCSEHCFNGSMCRSTDGYCLLNCTEGWIGKRCDTQCLHGYYGKECAFKCSEHCANASICTHTNGSCIHGCSSGWTGEMCEEEILKDVEGHTESRYADIAASVSVPVVVLVIFVVTAAFCWKRKVMAERLPLVKISMLCPIFGKREDISYDNQMYQNTQSEREACQNVPMTSLDTEIICDAIITPATDYYINTEECTEYYNTTPFRRTQHAIPVGKITSFVKDKLSEDGYFRSQFELIGTGLLHPTSVAQKRENMFKNRFKKVYPYDHSRVILKTLQGQPYSDYINACYIKSHEKERAYIASQGPVKENVEDFWRMIWEVDVRTVVMVTHLTENGKVKCMQYWDDDVLMKFGQIQVTVRQKKTYAEFTTRVFSICHQDDANTNRDLIHFHYTAWPDKDVPRTTNGLLHFWRQVRKQDENKQHTWLVHCSAGVGRTGTFLAMDILYDQGVNFGFIDVHQCVKDLRDQRVSMVQTPTQYFFLHLLMLEVFCMPFRPIKTDEFVTNFNSLHQNTTSSARTGLLLEYESLDDVFIPRKKPNVYTQNVNSEVDIPAEFRPVLSTFDPESPNLTKAAYLPSYFNTQGYITAQYPLENTSMETCRLIFEKQIGLVITFPNEAKMPKQVVFEEMSEEHDPFTIVCQSHTDTDDYIIKDHVLAQKEKVHSFKEIIFKGWLSDSLVPETTGSMLNLLAEVGQHAQQLSSNQEQSILFQCWDGTERSGLMVVLMNVMDRVLYDGEVSIPQVIRQLRHIRKVIPNFEQYSFCYEVLYSHLCDNATYANV